MFSRDIVELKLKEYKPILMDKYGVKKIGLFGSYVNGHETEESDIDIIVEFSKSIGWEFVNLKDYLQEILGKKVDLVTADALKPQLKERILKEVVYQ